MSLHANVRQRLRGDLAAEDPNPMGQLNRALRLMGQWRSRLIQNTMLADSGTVVQEGPFAGLDFLPQSAEGCHVPKLLGSYEQPLHPHILAAMDTPYSRILNIGCAEGYYAVGMARRMADTDVLAFDTDDNARATCATLAAKNGVAERVTIGALFRPEDFATHAGGRVLVLCDIEGAERELLDPVRAPALADMDLIVEAHDCFVPGISEELARRFTPTHEVTLVEDDGQRRLAATPAWLKRLNNMDQLLALWEWRSGPTPWLVMRARAADQSGLRPN